MEIPRFEKQKINLRIAGADIGEAFQGFVHEVLLPDHPQLHRFPGGGKDGGIDLIKTSDTCYAVECKVVGEDDYTQIEQRWKAVQKHFEDHLASPSGPTKGQAQYAPWYCTDAPIVEYVFCVSATFANEQQRRDFKNKITCTFRKLAERHSHLAHLGKITVSIIDWNDLCVHLRERPHTIFRWFPETRPNGLVPLDEVLNVGTFRAYLSSATLPYYSLSEHLEIESPPYNISILNEENLLAYFKNPTTTGLVINGKGGIGKSRLALELGWKALQKGWVVMRVQACLKNDALEKLAERLTPETPALLLVDYIEMQDDFDAMVVNLNSLNDSGNARICYVASCRTSYYYKAIQGTDRHIPVDLSPSPGAAALEWFDKYRSETVMKILEKVGIVVTERHVELCRDLPILAVFLSYLHTAGRTEDLAALLKEIEFGRWVSKRVQLSFQERDISRDLAMLVPMFPMEDTAIEKLQKGLLYPIFERLATDGWVEKEISSVSDSLAEWVTAHDVIVDQILLSYFHSIQNTAEYFVAELLSLAASYNCLYSAIISLQRIADSPPLNALPWAKIIDTAITANERDWRKVRYLMTKTTLLSVSERIELLHSHKGLWVGSEQDIGFHNALGWFARWAVVDGNEKCSELHKKELLSWILQVAKFVDKSNYVFTWGLRLDPQAMRDTVLQWISTRPKLFQTHYVMVAWLDTGGDKALVAQPIKDWIGDHKTDAKASHVYNAWLDAGGDKALVEQPIKDWLGVHKTDAEASHVYNAWLAAGGDKTLVEQSIKDWLGIYKTDAEAQFVYKAWLDAGGDKILVEQPIKDWLGVHKTAAEASHVYKAWLDAGGEKTLVEQPIKDWLGIHKTDAEASHVYKAWLDAGGDKTLVEQSIKDWLGIYKTDAKADFVYNAWLDAGGDKTLVEQPIKDWLGDHKTDAEASHVYKAWLDAGGDKTLVEQSIKDWLGIYKTDAKAHFVYKAWLDAAGETEVVWDCLLLWLTKFRTDESSSFVTKFIAKQPNLPVTSIKDVLAWCRACVWHEDVLWRVTQLGANLLNPNVLEDACATAETLLDHFINSSDEVDELRRGQITTLISYLVGGSKERSSQMRNRVDTIIVTWLRHPSSFGRKPKPHRNIQRVYFAERVLFLLDSGGLDLTCDRASIKRFLEWIDEWEIVRKRRLQSTLVTYRKRYPASDVWAVVRFA